MKSLNLEIERKKRCQAVALIREAIREYKGRLSFFKRLSLQKGNQALYRELVKSP